MKDQTIDCVFFDFGDTLAKEPFFVQAPQGVPDWTQLIERRLFETDMFDRWAIGEIDLRAVAEDLATDCVLDAEQVEEAMRNDCTSLRWNLAITEWMDSLKGGTSGAIVTINPDIFSSVIVPHYRLSSRVDCIVTSWEERTLDKVELCRITLARMGLGPSLSRCLLIDNKLSNTRAFETAGGQAHHFLGDTGFTAALADLSGRIKG